MRSLKWLSETGLSLFALSVFFSLSYADDSALGRAEALAGKVHERYGSADRLDQSVINPMTSGSVPLSNVEGSLSSNIKISCKASDPFLEVSVDLGPTGDLSLQATLDRNMNGRKSVYRPPFPVSGVCANGVIACDPGTWNHCRSLMWQFDGNRISLKGVQSDQVGGCYCVNKSCGDDLLKQNAPGMLEDIGGGIVGAVQGKNPGLAVTDAKVSGNKLVYSGQNNDHCRSGKTASSLAPLYGDSQGLNQPLNKLASSPESKEYATLVTNRAKDYGYTEKSCSIQQDYGIQTITQFCEQPVPQGAIGSQEKTQWMAVKTGSAGPVQNDCTFASDSLLPAGTPVVSNAPIGAIPLGERYVMTRCRKRRGMDRSWYDIYKYYSLCQRTSDIKTSTHSDNCAMAIETPGCQIKNETVDGVQVMRAHYQTGHTVSSTCRTYTGAVASFTECSPWWQKDRIYSCQSTKQPHNFAEEQMESLIGSVSVDGETMRYQSQQDGVLEHRSLSLPKQESVSACVSACKTQKIVTQTDVIPDGGHAGQYRSVSQREETHYKTCAPACPLAPGETLVKDCQCLNEFSEAAAMMSVLNAAGEELICSSGSKF